MFDMFKKKRGAASAPKRFPPVPEWQPSFGQPLDRVIDRMQYYTDQAQDFAVFKNGTLAVLPAGLTDTDANAHAKDAVHKVYYAHLDMYPRQMDDGNITVGYNHNVLTIVLSDIADTNWEQIDGRHQDALATDEVLITSLGHNVFDELGKKALFGRCYFFMDAQAPEVVRIVRKSI